MSRKKTMVPADLAIKVPQELVALAGDLVPSVQALPAYRWVPVSKAAVLRLALSRGLSVMAEELAEDVNLPAAADVVVQAHAPGGEPAPTGTTSTPPKLQPSPPAAPDDPESAFLRAYRNPSRRSTPTTEAGRLLREWRERQALTQAQAAERIGVAQNTWSGLELGKRKRKPSAATIGAIEKVTGIPADVWEG